MNTKEYLLSYLAEEALEISQAVHKAIRFGLDQGFEVRGRTNAQDIENEITDLYTIVQILNEMGYINWKIDSRAILDKEAKVYGYMARSRKLGILSETHVGI